MRASFALSAVCALLMVSGCARWPELSGEERIATRSLEPGEREALARDAWSVAPGVYRIRFSALYGYRGFEMPLAGIVEVDTPASRTRMVGFTDSGLTLFDIESEGTGEGGKITANFLVEGLSKAPDFAGTVGRGARRIFLGPFPSPGDTFEHLPERYLLRSKGAGGEAEFTLAGDGRLVAKESIAEGEAWLWRVRYSGHGDVDTAPFPALIDYGDDETGATLRLRLNAARLMR